jgi:hypothetical protein
MANSGGSVAMRELVDRGSPNGAAGSGSATLATSRPTIMHVVSSHALSSSREEESFRWAFA